MTSAAPIEIVVRYETDGADATFAGTIRDGDLRLQEVGGLAPELVAPASAFALVVARLVGLGPRPWPEPDAPVLVCDLGGVTGRPGLDAAVPADGRRGTPMADDGWVLWSVAAAWLAPEGPAADGLVVVDGVDHGLAVLTDGSDGAVLTPVTSRDVWSRICGLLPYAAALATEGAAT